MHLSALGGVRMYGKDVLASGIATVPKIGVKVAVSKQ